MLARLCSSDVRSIEPLMDSVDSSTRSRIMRSARQKNTRPELTLRKELHRTGLRYHIHVNALPGKPDIVFSKAKVAVFVHGCFWHRHEGCRLASTPHSRSDFLAGQVFRECGKRWPQGMPAKATWLEANGRVAMRNRGEASASGSPSGTSGSTRKEIMTAFIEEVGLTKAGAATCYQMIKNGRR